MSISSKRLNFNLDFLDKPSTKGAPEPSQEKVSDFDKENWEVLKIAFIFSTAISVIVVIIAYTI